MATAPASTQAIRYIESSALLAAILEGDAHAIRAVRRRCRRGDVDAHDRRITARDHPRPRDGSSRRQTTTSPCFARSGRSARSDLMAVTDDVLLRAARPSPAEPVRTLDAIHLATAELLGEPLVLVTIVTRDARIRENAHALGYQTE